METITLTYKRLPDRVNYFQQQLLYEDAAVIVTSQRIKPSSPIVLNGETVLADNFTGRLVCIYRTLVRHWQNIQS